MDQIQEFIDTRLKGSCIHCLGRTLHSEVSFTTVPALRSSDCAARLTRDHAPSISLLREPYPANLPVVNVCRACNDAFSLDEEYLAAFLGTVLAGSTEPARQVLPSARRILTAKAQLKARIDRSSRQYETADGDVRIVWVPEQARIDRVIVKNARGHVAFECGDPAPASGSPCHVWSVPLEYLNKDQWENFEKPYSNTIACWPEVGSRMMTRLITGQDLRGPWVVVQDGVYRYAVMYGGPTVVRYVLFEYLATEVFWRES